MQHIKKSLLRIRSAREQLNQRMQPLPSIIQSMPVIVVERRKEKLYKS